MYILHIETSTKICSIAISHERELVGWLDLVEGMNHTALLAPAIDQLMKSKGISPSDLSAISISSGPGSFTGLRVGSSTAKAMAYSLQIPILAVPTLLALAGAVAHKYPEAELIMPMLDARRNEVYTSLFNQDLEELIPVSSLILEEGVLKDLIPVGKKAILCGDGAAKVDADSLNENTMIDRSIHCSAIHLVEPAHRLWMLREYRDPMHFVPFYLKPPNITTPRVAL